MASVSASHLILFIASMIIAASVAGVLTDTVGRLSGAIDDQGLRVSEDVRTDVEIISDAGSPGSIYDEAVDNVTVLVKNTGSKTLTATPGSIDLIVNGQFLSPSTVNVVNDDSWRTGTVARVNASVNLSSGDHRVVVIVNGDREVLEFRT